MAAEGLSEVPDVIDDQTALQQLLRGSPKLQRPLPNVRDEILLYNGKSLFWCAVPANQVYFADGVYSCRSGRPRPPFGAECRRTSVAHTRITAECNSAMVLISRDVRRTETFVVRGNY